MASAAHARLFESKPTAIGEDLQLIVIQLLREHLLFDKDGVRVPSTLNHPSRFQKAGGECINYVRSYFVANNNTEETRLKVLNEHKKELLEACRYSAANIGMKEADVADFVEAMSGAIVCRVDRAMEFFYGEVTITNLYLVRALLELNFVQKIPVAAAAEEAKGPAAEEVKTPAKKR